MRDCHAWPCGPAELTANRRHEHRIERLRLRPRFRAHRAAFVMSGLVVGDSWPRARPDGPFCASSRGVSGLGSALAAGGQASAARVCFLWMARALWPLVLGGAGVFCDGCGIRHLREAGVVVCLVAPICASAVGRMVRRSSRVPGESGRVVRAGLGQVVMERFCAVVVRGRAAGMPWQPRAAWFMLVVTGREMADRYCLGVAAWARGGAGPGPG